MQGWYIGITAASQAVKAGSTPVPCSKWMNSVFRTFLSKSGVLLICKALTYQGFFLLLCKCMYSKTLRMRNDYFYPKSLFEHGFLTMSYSKCPQRLAESCISKFCEGVPHCKIEHTAPHFCESFVLRCTLCGTPLLFWMRQRRLPPRRCHAVAP